jgi:hypothetical protein
LLDAFEARFLFSQRRLRPGNEQVAAALDAADCGAIALTEDAVVRRQ